jgi:hypothetical protein
MGPIDEKRSNNPLTLLYKSPCGKALAPGSDTITHTPQKS